MLECDIAKNILADRTCNTCKAEKDFSLTEKHCKRWLGESCGWQWWPIPEERICEDWKK